MFRANFQRTGFYSVAEVRQLNGLKWQSQKFPKFSARWFGLTVAEGIVCVGSRDGNIYGLDSETGQELWAYQLPEKICASPVIHDGIVYLSSLQFNGVTTDQYLRAINVHSGSLKWQFKLDFKPLSLVSVSVPPSPVVSQGIVYIGATDGILYGIDVASGELAWSFKTTKNMTLTQPALKDDIICVASDDGYLYAIEISTRQQKWKYEIGGLSAFCLTFPAITDRAIFIISSDNTLYALNLQTGKPLWTFKNGNKALSAPIITEKAIYLGFGTSFYALDIETGKTLSSFQIGDMKYCSNPVVAENTVYIGSQRLLQALDLTTGEELWRFTTPLPENLMLRLKFWINKLGQKILIKLMGFRFYTEKFATPIIYQSVIYVGCKNGYIYALH